jgi:hypothetical protein
VEGPGDIGENRMTILKRYEECEGGDWIELAQDRVQ